MQVYDLIWEHVTSCYPVTDLLGRDEKEYYLHVLTGFRRTTSLVDNGPRKKCKRSNKAIHGYADLVWKTLQRWLSAFQ